MSDNVSKKTMSVKYR